MKARRSVGRSWQASIALVLALWAASGIVYAQALKLEPGAPAGDLARMIVAEGAPTAAKDGMRFPGWIEGFQPDKLDHARLRLSPGFCASADGRDLTAATAPLVIDLDKVGALGRDAQDLHAATDYFIYILRHAETGEASAVVSGANTYGGVAVPEGYRIVRKLRFGFVYDVARWGGIPDFHVAHWPSPFVSFTAFEDDPRWDALTSGDATTFTRISLAGYLPDNARLARVQVVVRSSGQPGSAYVRSWGGQQSGILAGVANATGPTETIQVFDIRVNSRRELEYRVTGGARLTVKVMGYSMTEPS
ncbi:MAG TPA: hypothetical protein VHN20_07180 [Beijerinckiaceae bacterium]|nr:hypothetical protein [Beijerinckiaceae bacterium]